MRRVLLTARVLSLVGPGLTGLALTACQAKPEERAAAIFDAKGLRGVVPAGSNSGESDADYGGQSGEAIRLLEEEGCISFSSDAEATGVQLHFLIDRSSSMAGPERWDALREALGEFIESSPLSATEVSLSFFPPLDGAAPCESESYEEVAVNSETLQDASDFKAALRAATPPSGELTPMGPALQGAGSYSRDVERTTDVPVAVVLVTDGLPSGCPGDSISVAADIAADLLQDGIPTYVIGVGAELQLLHEIAVSGGTSSAHIVDLNQPQATVAELSALLANIGAGELKCDIAIPPAPTGQIVHPHLINVEARTSLGSRLVPRDDECNGEGWRYDNPSRPEKILLCSELCNALKEEPDSSVHVIVGCQTALH